MKKSVISLLTWAAAKPFLAIGVIALLAAAAVGTIVSSTGSHPNALYATAKNASLIEEVDTSATVKAAESLNLAFARGGRVIAVNAQAGAHVAAGTIIASLDTADLQAAFAEAVGTLETQQAKLATLESGTRREQLAITSAGVSGATSTLAQSKQAVREAVQNAYIASDDAIHNKVDSFFTNPRTAGATLTFTVPDGALQNTIQQERVALVPLFSAWQQSVYGSSFATATDTAVFGTTAMVNLTTIGGFLEKVSTALAETSPSAALPAATLASYQTAVAAARTEVATALASVTSAIAGEQAAEAALASAQDTLALQQAGATQDEVAAQKAQVDVARAAVDQAQAALSDAIIRAPVAGTVTEQNAHVGETVAAGAPLVSFISDGAFEADAYVSETDLAKIALGDAAQATLIAYPQMSPLAATVTAIAPAATITAGVPSYKVTVTFTKNDPRLKPGLTTALRIITATKARALIVPVGAVIQNDNQSFVLRRSAAGTTEHVPVTLGIEGADGMVQILSGLSVGDQVLSFGSSTAP